MPVSNAGYSVRAETLESLASLHHSTGYTIDWKPLFVLPVWMMVWWQAFGAGHQLHIRSVWRGEKLVGIAPMRLKDETAFFIGDTDVCDYEDFVLAADEERQVLEVLLNNLHSEGVQRLDLKPLRPESRTLTWLVPVARERGYEVVSSRDEVALETPLPGSWEEYLGMLSRKQRHEVRRKMRRLSEEGNVDYRIFSETEGVESQMDKFLELFSSSRPDKATFLTPQRERFFRTLAHDMSQAGLVRLGSLELDNHTIAMVMYLDFENGIYLYNSGYDPRYKSLNAGLISKLWCIKESIARGKAKFDFLRGGEDYKYHLGGNEVPLFRCQVALK